MLPNKWCVQRTPETAAQINGYFNRLHGKAKGYEKTSGWMTNDTKSGEKGPFNKKPEGYTEITYQTFIAEFGAPDNMPNQIPVAQNNVGLPTHWIVKGDATPLMRENAKLLGEHFNVSWTGSATGYYGFDGDFKSRYHKEDFKGTPIELTPQTLNAHLLQLKSGTATGAISGSILAEQFPAQPVAPAVNTVISNYVVIKSYPGSAAVGELYQTSSLKPFIPLIVGNTEYYTPLLTPSVYPGEMVVFSSPFNAMAADNHVYTVESNIFNNDYQQWLLRLRRPDNHNLRTNIPLSAVRLATAEEMAPPVVIQGVRAVFNHNTKTVDIGANILSYDALISLQKVQAQHPSVSMTLPRIGILSKDSIDKLVENAK